MYDYRVLWHSATHWHAVPDQPAYAHADPREGRLITAMSDGELWQIINWCVANMRSCFIVENPRADTQHIDVSAKVWLRDQPVFDAMVVEAVMRGLAFETATFDYLRRFVIEPRRQRGDVIGAPPAWRDPQRVREQQRFREVVKQQKQLTEESQNTSARRELDI